MSFAKYGPRIKVHDTRQGAVKTVPNLWIVLHTSEGQETVASAEALGSFMTLPATSTNVASYHAVFDTDQVLPAVRYDTVAYSAGGGNAQGIHGCFPGRANQTREQWLDENSRNMIRQAAAWIADLMIEFDIPFTKITPAQMQAKAKGIADHYTVTLAFRKSTHTDVGVNFPWDVLFDDIHELIDPVTPPVPLPTPVPTPDPTPIGDMNMIRTDYGIAGTDWWWARMLISGNSITWVQGLANAGLDQMVPAHIQVQNDQHMLDLLATYKAIGPVPSTWALNPVLSNAWALSAAK